MDSGSNAEVSARTSQSKIRNPKSKIRRGFSFAEVLFAVIVLGIGFIMVAAIFPVAIQQSKLTVDESTAAAVARAAVNYVDQIATEAVLPPTELYTSDFAETPQMPPAITVGPGQSWRSPGKVVTFNDQRLTDFMTAPMPGDPVLLRTRMWNSVRGNLILTSDPRYAWIPLYKRDRIFRNDTDNPLTLGSALLAAIPAPAAHLIFIPVQIQNRTIYDSRDVTPNLNPPNFPNLIPRSLKATIPAQGANLQEPNTIALFDLPPPAANAAVNAVGTLSEGAFVVISDDNLTPDQVNGLMNGRIYRLGERRADLDQYNGAGSQVWEFIPGAEFKPESFRTPGPDLEFGGPDDVTVTVNGLMNAEVLVIGRGFTDPRTTPNTLDGYEGTSQDLSVFTTFVKVKPN